MATKKKSASTTTASTHVVPLGQARMFWYRKQFPAVTDLTDAILSTGWIRTLGGADVYLAARARFPALKRVQLDEAVARGEFQIVPSVRGCIYLVPSEDVPLALRIADALSRRTTERELEKVDLTWKDIDVLAKQVLAVFDKPMTTDEVRKALPAGAVKSLGEAGKKIGMSSPLPVALRQLEFDGKIRRVPVENRLDTERYVWHRVKGDIFAEEPRDDDNGRLSRLIESFLRFHGPATLPQLCAWSGFAQKDVKAALASMTTTTVHIEGVADEALVLSDELGRLKDAPLSHPRPSFNFLSFEDNLTVVHGGPALWVDEEHHAIKTPSWGAAKPSTLGEAKHLALRPILHGEKVAGFWEMHPGKNAIVTHLFKRPNAQESKQLAETSEQVKRFLVEEIGHAHSFSLDTDEAMTERATMIEKLNG